MATLRIIILSWLFAAPCVLLLPDASAQAQGTVVPNAVERTMRERAAATDNERYASRFRSAARFAARAAEAMAKDPQDKEAAAREMKGALTVLVDAAWEGADVKQIADDIGNYLVDLGAFHERGLRRLRGLLDLLAATQAAKKGTEVGSMSQSMAIRELVIALHNVIDSGWHDFWHSSKALRWLIAAAGSGAYHPDLIARFLAFVDEEDFSEEARARIARMIDDFAKGVRDGTIKGRDYIDAENRIRDAIRDESRRIGAARKAKHRKEVEELERAEAAAAQAALGPHGRGDQSVSIYYGPTIYGPLVRDIDTDKWKPVITPPIRPPEIVYKAAPIAPAEPVVPAAGSTVPQTPIVLPPPVISAPPPSVPAPAVSPPATPPPVTPPPIGPEPVIPAPIGPEPIMPGVPVTPPPAPPPMPPAPTGPPPAPPPMIGPF
jgi:hypothetical protein